MTVVGGLAESPIRPSDVDLVETVVRPFTGTGGTSTPVRLGGRAVLDAQSQGLIGIVHVLAAGEVVELDDDARVLLVESLTQATREAVAMEAQAVALLSELARCGIEFRVLKGAAVAHLDYADPGHRPFGDIDLLLRGTDIAAAVDLAAAAGFRRHFDEPFDGFDRHIGKGVAVENDRRIVIDIHRTLALGYFGTRLPVEDLWSQPSDFELAGLGVQALGRTQRFVHAALHMALSPTPRLIDGIDLHTMLHRSGVDPHLAISTAERWGCGAPVSSAIRTTTAWLGPRWAPGPLIPWAHGRSPSIRERVALAAFDGPVSGSRLRSLTAVAGLPNWRLRRRALRGLVEHSYHRHE